MPKELKGKVKLINEGWENIESSKISKLEIYKVIKLILIENRLEEKNVPRILNNLLEVEIVLRDDYPKITLENFIENFSDLALKIQPSKHINIVLQYIYLNLLSYYYRDKIIIELKKIGNHYLKYVNLETKLHQYSSFLSEIIKNEKIVIEFLEEKLNSKFFSNNGEYLEDNFSLDFGVKLNSSLIQSVYKRFIEVRWPEIIKNKKLSLKLISLKNKYLDLNEIKKLYKNILNICDTYDIDNFPEVWFKDMEIKLGEMSTLGSREVKDTWKDFSDKELKIYRKWLMNGKLEEYFTRKINEQERYLFWKKYLDHITEVAYYEEISQATVIEITNHTIVEFGEKGNAAYVYNLSDFRIRDSERINNSLDSVSGKLSNFKIRERAIKSSRYLNSSGWIHRGEWQKKFSERLNELGYRH